MSKLSETFHGNTFDNQAIRFERFRKVDYRWNISAKHALSALQPVKFPAFCICFLLYSYSGYAQFFYMGAGANFSFINNGSLDDVIHHYNDQRKDMLTKPMNNFRFFPGEAVALGYVGESGISYELAWAGRRASHSAETTDSTLDLKLRNNSFNIGFGYTLNRESVFKPGIFFSFDFGSFKSLARSGATESISDSNFEQVMKDIQLGMTFMLNLMITGKKSPFGIAIRPYYQFQLYKPDFQELNSAINPATAADDESLDLKESLGNFGVQAVLTFKYRNNR